MASNRVGSYYQGFAPRDFTPAHPYLWQDCCAAYAPCLGNSGNQVMDWSRHGTTMPGSSNFGPQCWLQDGPGSAVNSEATNNYGSGAAPWVIKGDSGAASYCSWNDVGNSLALLTDDITFSFWAAIVWNGVTLSGTRYFFARNGNSADGDWAIAGVSTAATVGIVMGAGPVLSPCGTGIANGWHHYAFVCNRGGNVDGYLDGAFVNSVSLGTHFASGTNYNNTSWLYLNASDDQTNSGVATSILNGGAWDAFAMYRRALQPQEIQLLATRRGVMYEYRPTTKRKASAMPIPVFQYDYRRRRAG
jgi:hypothetical protein